MSAPRNVCVLAVCVQAGERLRALLGEQDAEDAAQRCRSRAEQAVREGGGRFMDAAAFAPPSVLLATFADCDQALATAHAMLERAREPALPAGARQPLRIGLHYGAANASAAAAADLEAASQLARQAQPEQLLVTGPVLMLLTAAARSTVSAQPLGGDADLPDWPVFVLERRLAGLVTIVAPGARLMQRLRLRHQHDVVFVEEQRPVLLLGRELGNDMVIMDPRASRQHARIERMRDGFLLTDSSTNGSYVIVDGKPERKVHRASLLLSGAGRIGCGFPAAEIGSDLVFFDLV